MTDSIRVLNKVRSIKPLSGLVKKILTIFVLFQLMIFANLSHAEDYKVTSAQEVLKGDDGKDQPLKETNHFALNGKIYFFIDNVNHVKGTYTANWYNGSKLVDQTIYEINDGRNFYFSAYPNILGAGDSLRLVLFLDNKFISESKFSVAPY